MHRIHGSLPAGRVALLCATALIYCKSGPALAALGGDESSVDADRFAMKAELQAKVTTAKFTVHEVQTPSGTIVREYVSPLGKVFAISWRGLTKPDLRSALGGYFEQYVGHPRQSAGAHNHLQITTPTLVLHSSGHMRALSGHAYVPQLMPAGVTAEDIQ
jgi:hypothetical protein